MVEVDLRVVERLERSMLTSWPALSVAFDGDWVIRLADGVTKRSNSVTCLSADDTDLDARIEQAAGVYWNRGLPATFRLSPLASPALDRSLEARGWRRFDETIVMTAKLTDIEARFEGSAALNVEIATTPKSAWIKSCYRIDSSNASSLATLTAMLERLVPLAGYGQVRSNDRMEALAMVVIDRELAGLFEVLTIDERRRQGLARNMLHRVFSWSRQQGATTAWLAVVADNHPAVRLYQGLGFHEVYRYHYRSDQ